MDSSSAWGSGTEGTVSIPVIHGKSLLEQLVWLWEGDAVEPRTGL